MTLNLGLSLKGQCRFWYHFGTDDFDSHQRENHWYGQIPQFRCCSCMVLFVSGYPWAGVGWVRDARQKNEKSQNCAFKSSKKKSNRYCSWSRKIKMIGVSLEHQINQKSFSLNLCYSRTDPDKLKEGNSNEVNFNSRWTELNRFDRPPPRIL